MVSAIGLYILIGVVVTQLITYKVKNRNIIVLAVICITWPFCLVLYIAKLFERSDHD